MLEVLPFPPCLSMQGEILGGLSVSGRGLSAPCAMLHSEAAQMCVQA